MKREERKYKPKTKRAKLDCSESSYIFVITFMHVFKIMQLCGNTYTCISICIYLKSFKRWQGERVGLETKGAALPTSQFALGMCLLWNIPGSLSEAKIVLLLNILLVAKLFHSVL